MASLDLRVRVIKKKVHDRVTDSMVKNVLTCQNHSWIDQIGDYWVMFLLSKNLPAIAMKELLEELNLLRDVYNKQITPRPRVTLEQHSNPPNKSNKKVMYVDLTSQGEVITEEDSVINL